MWARLFSASETKDEREMGDSCATDDKWNHSSLLETNALSESPFSESKKEDFSNTIEFKHESHNDKQDKSDIDDIKNGNNTYNLEDGDHIYSWRAMGTYSHHGIVLSVTKVSVVILDFYASQQAQNSNGNNSKLSVSDALRVINLNQWRNLYGKPRKVRYNAPYLQRSFYRSGTCCSLECHPNFMVLARARFLLASSPTSDTTDGSYIPQYHALHANSETLSVWCKTGHYSTLQVADFLHLTWAGQCKSTFTLGAFLSTQTVQIPAAGVWGYMGFTTKIGLLASQPMLLPALMGYGILTVGTPMYMLRKCHAVWNDYEDQLNDLFWSGGKKQGDVSLNDLVLECMDHYYESRNFEKSKDTNINDEEESNKTEDHMKDNGLREKEIIQPDASLAF